MRIVVALLMMCRIAWADHGEIEGAQDDEVLKGSVLVWIDAPLYLDASETALSIRFGTLDRPRKDSIAQVIAMRVTGKSGAFVEVEPSSEVECASAKVEPDGDTTKLRLFVKRDDLALVVAKPYDAKLDGRTRITIEPGTPVGRTKDGEFAVKFDATEIPVAIPRSSVLHSYTSHRVAAIRSAVKGDSILDKVDVKLGDRTIKLDTSWTAPKIDRHGRVVLFPLRVRCMTAVVAAPSSAVSKVMLGGSQTLALEKGVSVMLGNGPRLPKGTPLTSPSGTHTVAVTSHDIPFDRPKDPSASSVCMDRTLAIERPDASTSADTAAADRTLHLYAPITALKSNQRF